MAQEIADHIHNADSFDIQMGQILYTEYNRVCTCLYCSRTTNIEDLRCPTTDIALPTSGRFTNYSDKLKLNTVMSASDADFCNAKTNFTTIKL
jgi:hypothetical protein